jgi:hypothetical protein
MTWCLWHGIMRALEHELVLINMNADVWRVELTVQLPKSSYLWLS